MSKLKVSPVVTPSLTANQVFSAKRVSAQVFDGLLDPIIGFDHFQLSSDVFGPHPHAGMSAITYLFEDSAPFRNLDSIGTDVVIQAGSLQWTFAGKGVVHNEFPETDGQRIDGLQLFINIPSAKKQMNPASYHIESTSVPGINENGIKVRVVSGTTGTITNPANTPEPLTFLDMFLSPGSTCKHTLPAGWNGTVYVISGKLNMVTSVGEHLVTNQSVIALGNAAQDEIIAFNAVEETHLLFISGEPTRDRIFQSGSFAMGSPEELTDTIMAYKQGKMGFIHVNGNQRNVTLPVE